MTNVIQFPNRYGQSGDVVCKPLGLSFPRIFRIEQYVTSQLISRYNLAGIEPGTKTNHSLHNDPAAYPGMVEIKSISTLDRYDRYSLIVRYHASAEAGMAYLQGLNDYGLADQIEIRTSAAEEGVFTLVNRMTAPEWPSPMIIYCANYRQTPASAEETWLRGVSVAGDWYDAADLAAPLHTV